MSFRLKIILGIGLIEAALLFILVWNVLALFHNSNEQQVVQRAEVTVKLFATMVQDSVIATDLAGLEDFLTDALSNAGIVYARIYDNDTLLAEGGDPQALAKPFIADQHYHEAMNGVYEISADITEAGHRFGRVEIGLSIEETEKYFFAMTRNVTLLAIGVLLLSALFAFLLGTLLVGRLKGLQQATQQIAKGEFGIQLPAEGGDEIAETVRAFNRMSQQLKDFLGEVQFANQELLKEVDERKRAELARLRSEELYQGLVENIGLGVVLISPKMEVLAMNRQMKLWFPAVDESLKPICFATFNTPAGSEICDGCPSHKTFEDGGNHELLREVAVDGQIRSFRVVSSPLRDEDGTITGAIEIVEDFTTRREVEEERQQLQAQLRQAMKMEAIGTLAAGIAHDFNNILSGVLGFTELAMMNMEEKSTVWYYLANVRTAGQRAGKLIRQILSFTHQSEQEFVPVQLQLIIKEALKLLRATIPSTIQVVWDIDKECEEAMVLADPTQMHQVLMNLCTNAFHAMVEEGGVLRVALSTEQAGSGVFNPLEGEAAARRSYLRILVSDTGVGMEQALIEKIFTPYFTTKEMGEGTGMGLFVVHGIVKNHGGYVTVESQPGQGAAFSVFLPLLDKERIQQGETAEEGSPRGSERVLVVDDEEILAKLLTETLTTLGYHPTTTTSSLEALKLFAAQPGDFDLVITDMTMPDLTGAGLARKILEIRPEMPIILCTGYGQMMNEQEAKAIGIKGYHAKPIRIRELSHLIRRVLEKSVVADLAN